MGYHEGNTNLADESSTGRLPMHCVCWETKKRLCQTLLPGFGPMSFGYFLLLRPFAFVCETVAQAAYPGTRLGFRWYTAQYADGVEFAIADIGRPSDALLRCGNCDAETNPCRYEGILHCW